MRNMLAFCDKHGIKPQIQKYSLDGEGSMKAFERWASETPGCSCSTVIVTIYTYRSTVYSFRY